MASVNDVVGGVSRPGPVGTSKEDWIGSQLKRVYDDALNETIPDEMMDLLSQLDDDNGSSGEDQS